MSNLAAGGRLSLWPILTCLASLLSVTPVGLDAASVCHRPPDPGVAFPMYNRLLTIRLPLRQDAATQRWAAEAAGSGIEALTFAGLHEIRHLLASVFPGKLWVHDASSAWLEANNTQLALRDLIIELNSPADSDHCSHVFQQHLFMAAETHAADTRFDLRQFSDIKVEYHHLFGACRPEQQEIVHFFGALRLDKADKACRGLDSAKDALAVAAGLPSDLYHLVDRLFFMPSSRYNSTALDGSIASNSSAPPPILLQSNQRLMAFVIDFRVKVDQPLEDWPRLGSDITDRYARLSRHADDYGIQRQGPAPSCLNYLNFAIPPATQLAASCGACYDISFPISVNISLSESADIRPPQCETVSSVRADASRVVMETRGILASLAENNVTAHLFLPSAGSGGGSYLDIRSVSCSAQPKRLVAELTVRLRARHPALLRHPLVLQSGLQRNINAHLVPRHLGLATVRLSGPVSANTADYCEPSVSVFDSSLSASGAQCLNNASSVAAINVLKHSFQLSLGQQTLLSQIPMSRPDLTTGLVRFFLTAAMSGIDQEYWLLMHSLTMSAKKRTASSATAAVIDVEAAYAIGDKRIDASGLNARFLQALNELQPDFGPLFATSSSMTLEKRSCANLTSAGSPVTPLPPQPPQGTTTPPPPTTGGIDSSHALRLQFTIAAKLLYGGRIGDYLVTSALNVALRRAGLSDIDDVDLTVRDCRAGGTCRVTALILCGNHSANSTGIHFVTLTALTASLSSDQLLRPADIQADIVPTLPPQNIPASSVIYRYAASPYFNRPPPSITGSNQSIVPVHLAIVWRLLSLSVSAPLAYRRLPSNPPDIGEHQLRFLLEQLLVDLLGARLLSWPSVTGYKSDSLSGRLEASVVLDTAGGALSRLSSEASTSADGLPLASFVRLSDLNVQPVRTAGTGIDSALVLQSFSLYNFVSNDTLQAMPRSDFERLLYGKLRFVQSFIFSGAGGRPSLLSFDHRASRRPDASIRVDALTRIAWPSAVSFTEAQLKKLQETELESLHADVNIFPMVFGSRQASLHLLDLRRGLASQNWCQLLLEFRSTPADVAVANADASWLPVADRLASSLGGSFNGHISVLSLSRTLSSPIEALINLPQAGQTSNCSAVAADLLKASNNNRLLTARSVSDGIMAAMDSAGANLSVLLRHSALLPSQPQSSGSGSGRDSFGELFCFLTTWAHVLFNRQVGNEGGVCVSNAAEEHRLRFDPLSDVSSPALRLSTVSAFAAMPPDSVMSRFWSLKNFYLASSDIYIDLDRMQLQLVNQTNGTGLDPYASLIINQLPPAPPERVFNFTTIPPATVAPTSPGPFTTPASTAAASATTARSSGPSPGQPPSGTSAANVATTAPLTTTSAPVPLGPYYSPVDRLANIRISLGLPSDPWQSRYFQAASNSDLVDYLIKSAIVQSLKRSAWQVAGDEMLLIRVTKTSATVDVGVDLLLTVDRNSADLESVMRTGLDQSMVLSSVFSKRNYSVSVVQLPVRRYLHRPPSQSAGSASAHRQTVEHRMLIQLSPSTPQFLRLRATGESDSGREDLLLDFLLQQLVIDACGSDRIIGRPELVQYKADSHLAMLHFHYEIRHNVSLNQFSSEFASGWQRLDLTASLRHIRYLDIRPGPLPPYRGLLLYQRFRMDSYINKESTRLMPSVFFAFLLRPKVEYVLQQVFNGATSSVPRYLDVDISYTKAGDAVEILALTRVSIAPGFRLAKLEQRLQLHVMQRLEELANDIHVVPSVFNVGKTDVRVLDLKEGLSQQYWRDLLHSFTLDGPNLPKQGFELATYLSQLLSPHLPRYAHLERLAVLQSSPISGGSSQQLEVQTLITLSSARSLPFDDAINLLIQAVSAASSTGSVRLVTRAVAPPLRGHNSDTAMTPVSSANYRTLQQVLTFTSGTAASVTMLSQSDSEKMAEYACHVYQTAVESANGNALYVVPHSCSAVSAVAPVRIPVNHQPWLTVPGLQLNISATVVAQTQSDDIVTSASSAFASALSIKNFYFDSAEIVLPSGANQLDSGSSSNAATASPVQPATTAPLTGTTSRTTQPPPTRPSRPDETTTAGTSHLPTVTVPAPINYYEVRLQFPLTEATFDFVTEPNTPMALLLAQYLIRDALSANATAVANLAGNLVVSNFSRLFLANNATNSSYSLNSNNSSSSSNSTASPTAFGQVVARVSPPSAVPSTDYLRAAVNQAIASWPTAHLLFTKQPIVEVQPVYEAVTLTPLTPGYNNHSSSSSSNSMPASTRTRRRRSVTPEAFVEHRLQLLAISSLPVYYRFRDIPLRPEPLVTFLTERLLNLALQRWAQTWTQRVVTSEWPKLVWLRSDNSSVTLCIRYPIPPGFTERATMDGFASAWVSVNRELAGCSLCLTRYQDVRPVASGFAHNETVGLLVYQRLQFDGFVGQDTMKKLDHDDLNLLMRHRLQFILGRLYPGGGVNISLAGFDFECYGRNSTVVTFMLVRLLARADIGEAGLRARVSSQLKGLATDQHVLPAQLSANGSDVRLLARRTGLPANVSDWLDVQATFEYATDGTDSLHGYALAAGAKQHLERLLARGSPRRQMTVVQLRLMRWKRLGSAGFGQHHQLVQVLATLASAAPALPNATPTDLRAELGNATGLSGVNLTLPLQDFDHEPQHYDRQHLDLLHTGVAVRQDIHLVDSGPHEGSSDESSASSLELASDFICLLLASAFRQRGSAKFRLVDDSCSARVAARSFLKPHPQSRRRIPATGATAYFTVHNSSQAFNAQEATDIIDQMAGLLNAYADVPGRTLATGDVDPIQPVPIYQLLKFKSAAFPSDLSNSSSELFRATSETIKRALGVYLRTVAHLFSGQVTDVRYSSGSIRVLIDYLIYPRLLSAAEAASHIEQYTEAVFASDGPFYGLQLDADGSFVSTAPIAEQRQPMLDQTSEHSVPVAIYCILGVACFLLLVLCTLLIMRLIRMRRQNSGKHGGRGRPSQSSGNPRHRRSILNNEEDSAEKGVGATRESEQRRARPSPRQAASDVPRIDLNDDNDDDQAVVGQQSAAGASAAPTTTTTATVSASPVPPRLPQPPESRRTSSTSRRASAAAATATSGAPAAAPAPAPEAAPAPSAASTGAPLTMPSSNLAAGSTSSLV